MNADRYLIELSQRNWEQVISQLKQINALLRSAHSLGVITHPKTGECIVVPASELSPQQVMDMLILKLRSHQTIHVSTVA